MPPPSLDWVACRATGDCRVPLPALASAAVNLALLTR